MFTKRKKILMLSGGLTPLEKVQKTSTFSFKAAQADVSVPGVLGVSKPADGSGDFTFARGSTARYIDSDGVIVEAPIDVARIDWLNGLPEFLPEPQSTNLLLWSEDFSNAAWSPGGSPVVTINNATSPDGTLNADTIEFTTTSDKIQQAITGLTIGNKYTLSFYIRADNPLTISIGGIESAFININITNEWVKYKVTQTASATDRFPQFKYFNSLLPFEIWGAQMEALEYSTSYIKTEGATVTRLGDLVTNGANVNVINSEEGVLMTEMSALYDDGTNRYISMSDNSVNNDVRLYYSSNASVISTLIKTPTNATQSFLSTAAFSQTDILKIASKYKLDDFALWVSAVEQSVDVSGLTSAANTITNISLRRSDGVSPFYGRIREITIYPTALSDGDLTIITE